VDKFGADILTIATAIVGLTVIAVLVSNKAQTSAVITSATGGFATDLKAAVSPLSS
jgi:hypothetical protein